MAAECIICTYQLDFADSIVATLCGHVFHLQCINKWLDTSQTCPQCRRVSSHDKLLRLYLSTEYNNTSFQGNGASLQELNNVLKSENRNLMMKNTELLKKINEMDAFNFKTKVDNVIMYEKNVSLEKDIIFSKSQLKTEIDKNKELDKILQDCLVENTKLKNMETNYKIEIQKRRFLEKELKSCKAEKDAAVETLSKIDSKLNVNNKENINHHPSLRPRRSSAIIKDFDNLEKQFDRKLEALKKGLSIKPINTSACQSLGMVEPSTSGKLPKQPKINPRIQKSKSHLANKNNNLNIVAYVDLT